MRISSIRFKLLLYFVIIASIPSFLLGYTSYVQSTEMINSQFGRYGEHSVTQLGVSIEEHMRQMNNIAGNILAFLSDPTAHPFTGKAVSDYNEHLREHTLNKMIDFQLHSYAHLISISLIAPSGMVYGNNLLQLAPLKEKDWWKSLAGRNEGKAWIGFHEADYYSSFYSPAETSISLIISMNASYNLPAGSKLMVDVKAKQMLALIHSFEQDTGAHLTIADRNGNAVYQTSSSFQARDSDIVWQKRLDTSGWTLEARMPFAEFNRSSTNILNNTLKSILISLVIALLLASWFSWLISRRLKLLNRSMIKVGLGQMDAKVKVDAPDEIGQLENRFNMMTERIQHLISDIANKEQLKKQAELLALHYQINPHLLFNTLNSVQWKAALTGQTDIQHMIFHLTALLQDSLDITKELVTLEKELVGIEHFLHIQRFRFGNVFEYEQMIGEGIGQSLIPRMSLQPLFENIFFHGFVDGKGSITLRISQDSGHLQLELEDDGDGVQPERLSTLLDQTNVIGRRGLGIRNVDERFKLHFGPAYGLTIHSVPGSGMRVRIYWPNRKGDTGDE